MDKINATYISKWVYTTGKTTLLIDYISKFDKISVVTYKFVQVAVKSGFHTDKKLTNQVSFQLRVGFFIKRDSPDS